MSTSRSATTASLVTLVSVPALVIAADKYAAHSIDFKNKLILWGMAAPQSKTTTGYTLGEAPYAVMGVTSAAVWLGLGLLIWAALFAGMSLRRSADEVDAASYADRMATNGYQQPAPQQPAAPESQQQLPPGYAPYGAQMGYPQQPMIMPQSVPTNPPLPENPGSG